MKNKHTIVICGAGIAGVATAYYLLQERTDSRVILIDKHQPLSFTTSKSGENFRDYWPQKSMRQFVSDSIVLMNELRELYGKDSFNMVKSGYNFISHLIDNPIFETKNQEINEDYFQEITDTNLIQQEYPYLDKGIKKIVRIKNAGKIDVYDLGNLMLREAKKLGLAQLQGEILGIDKKGSGFTISLDDERSIDTEKIVIAAGPFINEIAKMVGIVFPVSNTIQSKFIIPDPENIIPKNMPFTIYADAQYLDWSKEEAEFFSSDKQYQWLLEKFPGGLHIKPESTGIKLGWAFQTQQVDPTWEIPSSDFFPQVVLKGASRFIPALAKYESNIPTPLIQYAGHYTRTNENWPLIGNTSIENIFVIGALAGYGTMAACAAGKLCTNYVLEKADLPDYSPYFHPLRYQDEAIKKEMSEIAIDGQL